jgi:hypothetical protein
MKRVILLLLATSPFVFISAQTQKSKPIIGYAITSSVKGQTGWNEVRLVNILTGEELKPIYKNKQEVEILNARTKQPVAKKDEKTSNAPVVKKIVNLDNELNNPGNRQIIYLKESRVVPSDKPFSTNSAAMAFDEKRERLYYTPMGINQLRYIDLKSNKIYYFENEPFGVVTGMGDVSNQITRMVFGSDGNGYALANSGEHLIRFTTPKKVEKTEITDLGALTDNPANGKYSVHSKAGYGGDMIADAQGFLYLIMANHNIFKIDIKSMTATYLGTITGLPQGFTTNAAMVEEGSKVIVASSQSTVGYYRFDLKTMQAEKVSGGQEVFNASDLANGVFAFEKEKKKKDKEPEETKQPVNEQVDVLSQKPVDQSEVIKNSIAVYPNPVVNRYFNVSFTDQPLGKYQLQLYDVSGKLVSSKDVVIENKAQVEQFRLPSFIAAGNYLLKVIRESNNISLSNKLTVQ